TPGFLAKSITCSGQIIAIDQSLPNSSRTTRYVRVFWQLSDKPLLARIWSHGVRGAKRNGWSKIKRWAPSWRIGVAQLAIGVAAVVGSFEFNRAALAIAAE